MGPSRCWFGVQILLLQRGPGGPGWEMGEPASKGLVGFFGRDEVSRHPCKYSPGVVRRPTPPTPTCDIPSDCQLTMHATWSPESRTLPRPMPINKTLFTSTGPLTLGQLFPGVMGNASALGHSHRQMGGCSLLEPQIGRRGHVKA